MTYPETSLSPERCPFCNFDALPVAKENKTAFVIPDSSPVSRHHFLIIPKRHTGDYFDLNLEELCDCHKLIAALKTIILEKDPFVDGFNIGTNCGQTAGQTVFHMHIHLIPRRKNDTPHPRGGVRGVLPDKMDY